MNRKYLYQENKDSEVKSDVETDDDLDIEAKTGDLPEKPKQRELKSLTAYEVVKSEWKKRNIVEFNPKVHDPNERHIVTHQQLNAMKDKLKSFSVLAEMVDGKAVVKRDENNYLIQWSDIDHKDQPFIEMKKYEYYSDYQKQYRKQNKNKKKADVESSIKKAKIDSSESNQKSNKLDETQAQDSSQRGTAITANITLFPPRVNATNVRQIFETQDHSSLVIRQEDEIKRVKEKIMSGLTLLKTLNEENAKTILGVELKKEIEKLKELEGQAASRKPSFS